MDKEQEESRYVNIPHIVSNNSKATLQSLDNEIDKLVDKLAETIKERTLIELLDKVVERMK